MVFTTQCKKCGKVLWFSQNVAGTVTICPACGGLMRLEATHPPAVPAESQATAPSPESPGPQLAGESQPVPTPHSAPELATITAADGSGFYVIDDSNPQMAADDRLMAMVEAGSLTYQAAAAAGEAHVDLAQADLERLKKQTARAPQPPHGHPPPWTPPPLAAVPEWMARQMRPAPAQPPVRATSEFDAAASAYHAAAHMQPDERRIPVVLWSVAATAVVVFIVGLLLVLTHLPVNWETAHRQQIIDLKQTAENLAMQGKYADSYEKFQELERLTAGRRIDDPYLRDELEKAWDRRDHVYDLAMAAAKPPEPPAPAPAAPATAPAVAAQNPVPTTVASAAPPPTPQPPPRPAAPAHPPVHPILARPGGLTDDQIGQSITHGVDYLMAQFVGNHTPTNLEHPQGLDVLAVYALMQAGLATQDKRLDIHGPFLTTAIDAMKKFTLRDEGHPNPAATYGHALRATALALYDRPEDHATIRQDVDWLMRAQLGGAYTYNDQFPRTGQYSFWDNSNSQYGLLGVWSGAEVGIPVPEAFWRSIETHWTQCQMTDGEWGYRINDTVPRLSMTLAGIASLFVAQDYLDATDFGDRVDRPPFSAPLAKSLDWLETGDNSIPQLEQMYDYYTLYGLERVGLASGFKYFGTHDWYRERAGNAISHQQSDGSWGGDDPFNTIVDTSYAMLFLARGRHPIIMNKLRYDGDWANRPRDIANLARFASSELERPLNWQIVPLSRDWTDWTDSPILYLAGSTPPVLTQTDANKFRDYIENGGMLLMQADGGSAEFTAFATDLGKKLFPQYSWTDLASNSPLFSVSYPIASPPPMRVITNGSRILMMLWPQDLTHFWQLRQEKTARSTFELGVNLILYANGKGELRNRLETEAPAITPVTPAAGSPTLSPISYTGNWNPEPDAWPRAQSWFHDQTGLDFALNPVSIDDLATAHPTIAHLTGTAAVTFTPAQISSVRDYVQSGGLLVIDPCGHPNDFLQSVRQTLLPQAFPNIDPVTIDANHPLLSGRGNGMTRLTDPALREFVRTLPPGVPTRPTIFQSGQGHVIVLPIDWVSGLVGVRTWGIAGYQPDYSLSLMKNIVLWAWSGSPE